MPAGGAEVAGSRQKTVRCAALRGPTCSAAVLIEHARTLSCAEDL